MRINERKGWEADNVYVTAVPHCCMTQVYIYKRSASIVNRVFFFQFIGFGVQTLPGLPPPFSGHKDFKRENVSSIEKQRKKRLGSRKCNGSEQLHDSIL